MAIANATIVATVTENINPKWIATMVRTSLNRKPKVYSLAAKVVDLTGKNTATYSHPIRAEISQATPYTETDLVTATKIERDEVSVSTADYVKAAYISYRAARLSMWDEFSGATEELVGACQRRIDNDFLALAPSFTSPIGNAATNNTASNLMLTLTTWRARVASTSGSPVFIMHGDAVRDLQQDAISNGAALFGTVVGTQLHETVNGLNQGVMGVFNNVRMVTTDNIPVGDTTGWSNMLVATGDNDCAIAMPVDRDIQVELAHRPETQGFWLVAGVSHGMGIVNNVAGLTVITRT